MSRVRSRRAAPRWAVLMLPVLLASVSPGGLSGAEARRPRGARGKPGDGEAADRRPDRGKARVSRADPAPDAPPRAPAACDEAGCEAGLRLLIEEEGTPPRPVPALRYRLRLGEQRIEGACPREKDEGPEVARCRPGGLLLPFAPEVLDVAVEAPGLRPLLQTLRPQYETRGCCQRAETRIVLRRESDKG